MKNLYLGLMSGTSLDGVDAVVLAIDPDGMRLLHSYYYAYPDNLRQQLASLCNQDNISLVQLGQMDAYLGQLFSQCVLELLKTSRMTANQIRAIGSHGQTIHHAPDLTPGFTLQIGDPNQIAAMTGITTVADFRRKDLALGGQGAPLVPAFHRAAFGKGGSNLAIINIGGIANVTLLSADKDTPVLGFDTGPGNCLMNFWIQHNLDMPYDRNGDWGKSGEIHQELLDNMLQDGYFHRPSPKSTGPEYFSSHWLLQQLDALRVTPSPVDIQATLCALTAQSVADALAQQITKPERIMVCGGGAHNKALMNQLRTRLNRPVSLTDEAGIGSDWVEACAFAWLAKQTLEGKAGSLSEVTGANRPAILGAIFPP